MRKLTFDETPDYDFLRELFATAMKNNGDEDDQMYDWMKLNDGQGWQKAVSRSYWVDASTNPRPLPPLMSVAGILDLVRTRSTKTEWNDYEMVAPTRPLSRPVNRPPTLPFPTLPTKPLLAFPLLAPCPPRVVNLLKDIRLPTCSQELPMRRTILQTAITCSLNLASSPSPP